MFNLNEEEKKHEFDFEMAVLDIKAERFAEAEERFSIISRDIKSANAYLGIGITKFSHFIDGATTLDEIFYCFEKALSLSSERDEMIVIISEVTLNICKQISEIIIIKAFELRDAQATEIKSKLLLMGSMMAAPLVRDRKNMRIANSVVGVGSLLNIPIQMTIQRAAGTQGALLALKIDSLKEKCTSFLEMFPEIKTDFLSAYQEIEDYTYETAATPEQKQRRIEKEVAEKFEEEQKLIFEKAKGELPANSPYHTYRNNALQFWNEKKYNDALKNTKEALYILPDDFELKNIDATCLEEAGKEIVATYFIKGFVFFLLGAILIRFFGDYFNDTGILLVLPVLLPVIIAIVIGAKKTRLLREEYNKPPLSSSQIKISNAPVNEIILSENQEEYNRLFPEKKRMSPGIIFALITVAALILFCFIWVESNNNSKVNNTEIKKDTSNRTVDGLSNEEANNSNTSDIQNVSDQYICHTEKSYFYDTPDFSNPRKAYLSMDDEILITKTKGVFGYGEFTSPVTGKTSSGWLLLTTLWQVRKPVSE